MQWGVRQHHTEFGRVWGHGGGHGRFGTARQEHNRSRHRCQEIFLGRRRGAESAHRRQIGRHHGERLVLAVLAAAQGRDRCLVGGEGGEVVAAEPLDRHDLAAPQRRGGLGEAARQRRSAVRAAHRLGVEASIGGVGVLRPAAPAHLEVDHRGAGTVVGDAGHDGVARAAIRAVGEGVAEAAILGVEDLPEAIAARRHVGGNERRCRRLGRARPDDEIRLVAECEALDVNRADTGQRWRSGAEALGEGSDRLRWALHLDRHARRVRCGTSRRVPTGGPGPRRRAGTYPLDDSGHQKAPPDRTRRVHAADTTGLARATGNRWIRPGVAGVAARSYDEAVIVPEAGAP